MLIVENGLSLFESNAMLLLVLGGLLWVPGEAKRSHMNNVTYKVPTAQGRLSASNIGLGCERRHCILPGRRSSAAIHCRWHGVSQDSLGWKTRQEVLGSGKVIVPRVGVDLPLAQFCKRLSLDSLRVGIHAIDG